MSDHSITIASVCVDAVDPERLAGFWAALLDWHMRRDDDGDYVVAPEGDSRERGSLTELLFLRVPEQSKTFKNRLHLDLSPVHRDQAVSFARELGAVPVDVGQGDDVPWVVLADPEGNEFCILSGTADR